jgi:hypothetical protein
LSIYADPACSPTVQGNARSPLSCHQRRLLYVNALDGGGPTYNCAFLVTLRGSLNEKLLEKAIDAIARRHAVLRTPFVKKGPETFQRLDEDWHFRFTTRPSSIFSEGDLREFMENKAHCVFDPASAPPWQSLRLYRRSKARRLIMDSSRLQCAESAEIAVSGNKHP